MIATVALVVAVAPRSAPKMPLNLPVGKSTSRSQ